MKRRKTPNRAGSMRNAVAHRLAPAGAGQIFAAVGDVEIKRANECHLKARESMDSFLNWARKAGEHLLEAQRQIGDKRWLRWLDEKRAFGEFKGSVRTAQGYMAVARRWKELKDSPGLSLRKALNALASKKEGDAQHEEKEKQRKLAEQLTREVVDAALAGWTDEERAWLAERYADVDYQIDSHEILTAAFQMVRERVQQAMANKSESSS